MDTKYTQTNFEVTGMDCTDEVTAIKSALDHPGIIDVTPSIVSSRVLVTHTSEVTRDFLIQKIESSGVKIKQDEAHGDKGNQKEVTCVALAGLFLLVAIILNYLKMSSDALINILVFLSIGFGLVLVGPKGLRSIRNRTLDMNLLMLVALVGSVAIKEYLEGATVVFLFSLSELLESMSLRRARRSIESLLKLTPDTALVKRDSLVEVAVSEVKIDETIVVKSGEKIPLDGKIVKGKSSVNQAPITGESVPVLKSVGDTVLAGTLCEDGSIEVQVTVAFKDTKLSQIIRLIEDAQEQKAPTQRFVDRFAEIYTPVVFALAVLLCVIPPLFLGGDWNVWFYRALVLLVVACPCALVISTPISVVSGLTAMARRGILIKGGAALEVLGKLEALAVDKTGTITEGHPKVISITPYAGHDDSEVLAIAAAIDAHSTHPLAKAVSNEAEVRKIKVKPSDGYQAHSGRGAEAVIDGHIYFVGNHLFAHDNAACSEELETKLREIEDQAYSVVIVGHRPHAGCKGSVLGVIAISDPVREGARDAIQLLHRSGLKEVVMLSGDNAKTVKAIAKEVGIDDAYGDLLPADKVMKLKQIMRKFRYVGMIGDGVNDAPAMATASMGIAMGASGTDTAIETADMTLMRDQLSGVAEAVKMGRRTLRVIWFNTSFAIVVKFLFLVLSIVGYSSLWLAIAADTGATILVIGNSLRLLRQNGK